MNSKRKKKRGLERSKSTLNKKFRLSQRKKKEKIRQSKSLTPPHSPSSRKSNRMRHLNRVKSGIVHSRDKNKMYHYHDEKNSTDWQIGHAPGLLLETLIDPQYVNIEPSADSFQTVREHMSVTNIVCITHP